MVSTRGSGGDVGSGSADQITGQLEAIMTKLKALDSMQVDIANLKAKDREKGSTFEEGESSFRSGHSFRPHNKIDFPKFSEGDPRGWIIKAEKYFRYYHIPEDEKVDVASMHLEGDALDLYSWLSSTQEFEFWEDLVRALQKHFGPAEFQNPDEHLCNVKQVGSVQEYRQEFARRSSRVTGWPDHCLLGVFLHGLKEELKTDVRIHKPRTVYKAINLALEYESKAAGKGGQEPAITARQNQAAPAPTGPADLTQPSRLSDPVKQARFAKGECFRCGEKFGPGHRCKPSYLQVLEAGQSGSKEYTEDDDPERNIAEISLHAITGMQTNTMMIIPGYIKTSKVSVLVDCGSTHNFINDSLIQSIGLPTHDIVPFGVRIGNGDIIRCSRVCKNVQLRLNDLDITQDFFPFALGGAEVVLGVQWLATLNTVQANWKTMFLKFNCNGKDYKLEGRPPDGKQSTATFRNLTIEPIVVPTDEAGPRCDHIRLEDKSFVPAGSIDTNPVSY